jgi:rfaE bifunctional protein kinase chain/domain
MFRKVTERRGITKSRLENIVGEFDKKKIMVLGDLIIDEFKSVEPLGVSSEAPVIVVKELGQKRFVGGAGIVAAHVASLGGGSCLLSVRGDDEVGEYAEIALKDKHVDTRLIVDPSRPTTFKTRFVVGSQKIFRVSKLDDRDITAEIEDKLFELFSAQIKKAHGLVISDFVYGVVTDNLLHRVVELANKENVLLFGDVQCSTQFGNVLKFKNFDMMLPNEREARLSVGGKDFGLEYLAQQLILRTKSKAVGLTLDRQGMIIYDAKSRGQVDSEHFPALALNPIDVAGAGDSMLAVMAIATVCGADCFEAAALGCLVAQCAINKIGNVPVDQAELVEAIRLYMES